MKKLSVGTIIRDYNKNILVGHTTFGKGWDIPKGLLEEGEYYLDTATRELKEEFNLVFDEFEFEQLGKFEYNKEKVGIIKASQILDKVDEKNERNYLNIVVISDHLNKFGLDQHHDMQKYQGFHHYRDLQNSLLVKKP